MTPGVTAVAVLLGIASIAGCKSTDDLKAACENGAVSSCQQACEKGVAGKKGCLSAAEAMYAGKGIDKDVRGALQFARKACDGREPYGCSMAARMVAKGEGTDSDKRQAAELYERACDLVSPTSCDEASLWFGEAQPPDFDRAEAVAKKGCEQLAKDTTGDKSKPKCEALEALRSKRSRIEHGDGPAVAGAAGGEAPPAASAASGRPTVRFGDATISGKLSSEAVQRVVRQNFGRFRLCYENGLKTNPSLKGKVTVRFTIGRDGTVANPGPGPSDLSDAAVVSCVVRSFSFLTFPAPESGAATVDYPITFAPAQ
jgi:TPR repeat protein